MKNKLIILILILIITGCSASRPHTKSEKAWLVGAVAGQAADVYTTDRVLRSGGIETNSLYGKHPNMKTIAISKLVVVGVAYIIGQFYPESRKEIYPVLAIMGVIPAIWNETQVSK